MTISSEWPTLTQTFAVSEVTVADTDEHAISSRSTKPPKLAFRPRPSSGTLCFGFNLRLGSCSTLSPSRVSVTDSTKPLCTTLLLLDWLLSITLHKLSSFSVVLLVDRFFAFIVSSCFLSNADADRLGCCCSASSEDLVSLSATCNSHSKYLLCPQEGC